MPSYVNKPFGGAKRNQVGLVLFRFGVWDGLVCFLFQVLFRFWVWDGLVCFLFHVFFRFWVWDGLGERFLGVSAYFGFVFLKPWFGCFDL